MYPQNIAINNKEYEIIVKYKLKRNASATFRDNKIFFYFPKKGISKKKEEEIFSHLLKNILKKITMENRDNKKYVTFKEVLKKGIFKFNNTIYEFKFYPGNKYLIRDNIIFIPRFAKNIEIIEKRIIKLLINEFSENIKNYVYALNKQTFSFLIKDVQLKYFKSKFGHCTFDNIIAINLILLNYPRKYLEYVVIHELAHVKEKNHSEKFWELVEKYVPNYKILRREMKKLDLNVFSEI